jgi:Multiubiquitin
MHVTITIEINGHGHEVHHRSLTGAQIRAIARHEQGALYQLRGDERRFIADDEVVELHDNGRFEIVEHELICIIIEDKKYETRKHVLTGSQIKELGHQPPGNYLYRLACGERIPIEDDQKVHLHDGEVFITQPPCGHAS